MSLELKRMGSVAFISIELVNLHFQLFSEVRASILPNPSVALSEKSLARSEKPSPNIALRSIDLTP